MPPQDGIHLTAMTVNFQMKFKCAVHFKRAREVGRVLLEPTG